MNRISIKSIAIMMISHNGVGKIEIHKVSDLFERLV